MADITPNLQDYLDFAEATAREAGALTLDYFLTDAAKPEFKGDDTPVTVADRNAEKHIREQIGARFPDHLIVGEEFGSDGAGGDGVYRWIIDPIDGTKSFVHGVPLYAVLLALEINGNVEVGCAYFPALDEMISGANGLGAFWNGEPCHVSSEAKLDRAVCAHIDTAYFAKNGKGA
ncbi:MAG: inositol monophosphatase family protein, partial [Verrucomicrobiota bacterium]